jgi:hypothetical protein
MIGSTRLNRGQSRQRLANIMNRQHQIKQRSEHADASKLNRQQKVKQSDSRQRHASLPSKQYNIKQRSEQAEAKKYPG